MVQAIIQIKQIRINLFYDLKLKTDLGGTLGKNLLRNRLVRLARKFAKSVTETSSKVQKPKTYDKAINDPIYRNRWYEAIDKKL